MLLAEGIMFVQKTYLRESLEHAMSIVEQSYLWAEFLEAVPLDCNLVQDFFT